MIDIQCKKMDFMFIQSILFQFDQNSIKKILNQIFDIILYGGIINWLKSLPPAIIIIIYDFFYNQFPFPILKIPRI